MAASDEPRYSTSVSFAPSNSFDIHKPFSIPGARDGQFANPEGGPATQLPPIHQTSPSFRLPSINMSSGQYRNGLSTLPRLCDTAGPPNFQPFESISAPVFESSSAPPAARSSSISAGGSLSLQPSPFASKLPTNKPPPDRTALSIPPSFQTIYDAKITRHPVQAAEANCHSQREYPSIYGYDASERAHRTSWGTAANKSMSQSVAYACPPIAITASWGNSAPGRPFSPPEMESPASLLNPPKNRSEGHSRQKSTPLVALFPRNQHSNASLIRESPDNRTASICPKADGLPCQNNNPSCVVDHDARSKKIDEKRKRNAMASKKHRRRRKLVLVDLKKGNEELQHRVEKLKEVNQSLSDRLDEQEGIIEGLTEELRVMKEKDVRIIAER